MLQSHQVEGTAALPGRQPLTAGNESAKPVSKHRMMDPCFEPSQINFFFFLFLFIHRQMHQLARAAAGNIIVTI